MAVTKHIFASREEWLKGRKNHIGGSDASACVGMNPYKDNVADCGKKRMGLGDAGGIFQIRIMSGTAQKAEKHLRALFSMDFPEYQVFYDEDNMFINDRYPWMHASLDGELVDEQGRRGILEIKTLIFYRVCSVKNGMVRYRTIIIARCSIIWQ